MVKISKMIETIPQIVKEIKLPKTTKIIINDSICSEGRETIFRGYKASNIGRVTKYAITQSHKDLGGTLAYGYPDYYTKLVDKVLVEAKPEREIIMFGKTRKLPATKEYWDETRKLLPNFHIDKIWTTGKGSGKNSIKDIVRKSLKDSETQGRVTLDSCCIDGKTCPSGFYYKLGFRFKDPKINTEFETWLKNGGIKEEAPFYTGSMFLPKENISKCLNY